MLKDLSYEFSSIQSREDLQKKGPILKKKLRKLTALMVEAAQYHRKHEEESFDDSYHVYSDKLYYEILRVCQEVDGGKLFLEELQHDMLDKLDVDQRKHQKKSYGLEK